MGVLHSPGVALSESGNHRAECFNPFGIGGGAQIISPFQGWAGFGAGNPGRRALTRFALGCHISPRLGWGMRRQVSGIWLRERCRCWRSLGIISWFVGYKHGAPMAL